MTAQVRLLWSRLNANYWFYPALFSIGGAALALAMIWLDRNGFADWLNGVPEIVPARPDGASNMLTVIAGAMIGTAATVFSITIAAVAYASGTYGPRLLTNFMEDRGNQFSLATFIGTFVYSITVLRSVRGEDEAATTAVDAASSTLPGFVPQLGLLVAYALMALSVAVLVYFLNHIPSSIRINTVLHGIGHRLLKTLGKVYPDRNTGEEAPHGPAGGTPVVADRTGYIQLIDFEKLCTLADARECAIVLKVRTGDFVHPGMTFARVCPGSGKGVDDLSEDDLANISECYSVGASRTPAQDPQFLIDELVEIGLRALSPGINDPFTAITALHWLGAATAELGSRDLLKMDTDRDGEGERPRRVFPLPDDFAHYLNRGFGAMRSAVATSHTAALVMFDALRHAAAAIDDASHRRLIRQHGKMLIEQVRTVLDGPDLQEIEARFVSFDQAMG